MFVVSCILISTLFLATSTGIQASSDGLSFRGQYPFYVYLEVHSRTLKGYAIKSCGSTLLSKEWIVTSAHCVKQATRVQAHFGSHKFPNILEEGHQIRTIGSNDIYIHPRYSPLHFSNDIALLKIPNPIQLSDTIQPAQLGKSNVAIDSTVIAIGNGSNNKKDIDILKSTKLQTITKKDCVRQYPVFMFNDSVLCAKRREGQTYCLGHTDDGGPLIREFDNKLIGINKYSLHIICERRLPKTFTALTPELYKWISQHTKIEPPHN